MINEFNLKLLLSTRRNEDLDIEEDMLELTQES